MHNAICVNYKHVHTQNYTPNFTRMHMYLRVNIKSRKVKLMREKNMRVINVDKGDGKAKQERSYNYCFTVFLP